MKMIFKSCRRRKVKWSRLLRRHRRLQIRALLWQSRRRHRQILLEERLTRLKQRQMRRQQPLQKHNQLPTKLKVIQQRHLVTLRRPRQMPRRPSLLLQKH